MHTTRIILSIALLAALPLGCATSRSAGKITPEQAAVMAPVHQFVDGFNDGNSRSAMAACTDPICIIDDFPPHEWEGEGALSRWMEDFEAVAKKEGMTDGIVTLGDPRHVDITADRAYVVVPANFSFKKHGEPVTQANATFTLALHKGDVGWRITGWAWSKH